MKRTTLPVEVHEVTIGALLDLLAPVVMGTYDEYMYYLQRGCDCFAPDYLPLVRVGDWLVVSGRVRFGGCFGQVMICSAHSTLDYALAYADAAARYDCNHPSTFCVPEYEVWHVVDDAPEIEPVSWDGRGDRHGTFVKGRGCDSDSEPQALDGLPCDCAHTREATPCDSGDGYEVFLYTSNVDDMGEYIDELAGSVCFNSFFDAKGFARHSMCQIRPYRDGQSDGTCSPFSAALVTRYVFDESRWVLLGKYRRGYSGKVTWHRFRGAM